MTKFDPFIRQELAPRLAPGESIAATGFLSTKQLGKVLLVGGWALVGSGYFFAAATETRLLLIHTSRTLTSVKLANEGVTEIPYADIVSVQGGGSRLQPMLTLALRNGTALSYHLFPGVGSDAGQQQFVEALAALHRNYPSVTAGAQGYAPSPGAPMPPPVPTGAPFAPSPPPPPAPPGAPGTEVDVVDQLKELAALHQAGVLTPEEYGAAKAELLKRI